MATTITKLSEDGHQVTVEFTWTSEATSSELNSTTIIDVSSLEPSPSNGKTPDSLKIEKVWSQVHLDSSASDFTGGIRENDAMAAILHESNFDPILALTRYSDGKLDYSQFGGLANTKTRDSNSNGDLKVSIGQQYNVANGNVAAGGVNSGSTVHIVVRCIKVFDRS